MKFEDNNKLLAFLQRNGPTYSKEITEHLKISRATLSRGVRSLGSAVVTIGKGRATQIAARHENIREAIKLYRISEKGQAEHFAELIALQNGSNIQWFVDAKKNTMPLFKSGFENGLFPGWPWFLEDLRPSGFLGRAFSKRMARLFQLDENPERWNDLELVSCLEKFGSNLQGDFLLGNDLALQEFNEETINISNNYYRNVTPQTYPLLANEALTEGEKYGSSAGGEQQKFTTMVCDNPEQPPRSVVVKFSPKLNTPSGQRWADLLRAEHAAGQILNEAGLTAADSRIFELEGRVFLESKRFDRLGACGRRGLVSLRAFDAAHLALGSGWDRCAFQMYADKWIRAADSEAMVRLYCFGELIANNDMHLGNLSFFIPKEQGPYSLAPVYDMLPMFFRPSDSGEIVERRFKPKLPKPENRENWLKMHPYAVKYWERIMEEPAISNDFKMIAAEVLVSVKHIYKITAG